MDCKFIAPAEVVVEATILTADLTAISGMLSDLKIGLIIFSYDCAAAAPFNEVRAVII